MKSWSELQSLSSVKINGKQSSCLSNSTWVCQCRNNRSCCGGFVFFRLVACIGSLFDIVASIISVDYAETDLRRFNFVSVQGSSGLREGWYQEVTRDCLIRAWWRPDVPHYARYGKIRSCFEVLSFCDKFFLSWSDFSKALCLIGVQNWKIGKVRASRVSLKANHGSDKKIFDCQLT